MAPEVIVKWVLNAFELTAACAGLYHWDKWKNTYWKWFTIFLFFIFITEMIGKYLGYYMPAYNIRWYRYVNIPVYFLFLLWLLGKPSETKSTISFSRVLMVGYIILFLAEEFLFNGLKMKYRVFSYQFGTVGILILSVEYFIKLLQKDSILFFKSDIKFWVSSGLIIYMIIMLPFKSLFNVLDTNNYHRTAMTYWYLSFLFNYIMYSFFTLGFVWGKPKLS